MVATTLFCLLHGRIVMTNSYLFTHNAVMRKNRWLLTTEKKKKMKEIFEFSNFGDFLKANSSIFSCAFQALISFFSLCLKQLNPN